MKDYTRSILDLPKEKRDKLLESLGMTEEEFRAEEATHDAEIARAEAMHSDTPVQSAKFTDPPGGIVNDDALV